MSRCPDCGRKTACSGRCQQCAIIHRHEPDNVEQPDRGEQPVECTQCGTHYRTAGGDECPDCGSRRRRYAGELATDGGE